MRVLFLAAEAVPFVKVGGLADVAGALPQALAQLGVEVRLMMPRYGQIDAATWGINESGGDFELEAGGERLRVRLAEADMDGVPVTFVDAGDLFAGREGVYGEPDDGRRFLLYCAATLEAVQRMGWRPDVIHANEWQTAIVPALLKHGGRAFFTRSATLFTIHNLVYQGVVERAALGSAAALLPPAVEDDPVNFMLLGVRTADVLTTVSPTYAQEILTPEYGAGLDPLLRARRDRLFGVLNGIDVEIYDPARDPHIAANYSLADLSGKAVCKRALQAEAGFAQEPQTPLMGMIGRLVDQKGIDLLAGAIEGLLRETPLQMAILGIGEAHRHDLLERLERQYPDRLRAWLRYDAALAQRIYAGADLFLMPSRYEPCGLGQMIAMRYGTVPVVRATGGLVDTVHEGAPGEPGTGFVFWPYDPDAMRDAIRRALALYRLPREWAQLVHNAMEADYSWTQSARAYVELYERAVEWKREELEWQRG